jgi:hypothetical protein
VRPPNRPICHSRARTIRRRGVLFVLAGLPDGSRTLIPAQWTDWEEGHCGGVRACREANVGSCALGSLGDPLRITVLHRTLIWFAFI